MDRNSGEAARTFSGNISHAEENSTTEVTREGEVKFQTNSAYRYSAFTCHGYIALRRGELERVGDQIAQHLSHTYHVSAYCVVADRAVLDVRLERPYLVRTCSG
jgi:hypothetical protein